MNIPILVITIGGVRAGILFQYAPEGMVPTQQFCADEDYAALPFAQGPVLSELMRAQDPEQQRATWLDYTHPVFNGAIGAKGDKLLPAFFQNLLPEGVFRNHVAQEAQIDPRDHIAMLAACGNDLPGNVRAQWQDISRDTLQKLITQNHDALEMTVWAEPFQDAIAISGVQPKLAVNQDAEGRFVGRTRLGDTSIIAKLPTPDRPRMPQVEDLSMRMARAAGVNTCSFSLEPLARLTAPHAYDLADEVQGDFLAVRRFDRTPAGRVHFEDFAQVLGVQPDNKNASSYAEIAATLLDLKGCGVDAVHELIRRIMVNDLIGNADMHLKNLGLLYPDGKTATLAPAYDVVAYGAFQSIAGHALALIDEHSRQAHNPRDPLLSPKLLQTFCNLLNIQIRPASAVVRETVDKAIRAWSEMIQTSGLTARQKRLLLTRVHQHPHVQSALKRQKVMAVVWEAAQIAVDAADLQFQKAP